VVIVRWHRVLQVGQILARGWQPDSAMLRQAFEEALTRRRQESSPRTPAPLKQRANWDCLRTGKAAAERRH